MKRLLLILLVIPTSGCLMEVLTVTAIQGELAAQDAQTATRALGRAKAQTATTEIQHSIDAYTAENGFYPTSLQDLVPDYYYDLPRRPDGTPFGYDPATGRIIDDVTAAEIPYTAEDEENILAISDAIFLYWESTGYYPASLDDLDPLYIKRVPLTTQGVPFVYDPAIGGVYHPSEGAQIPAAGGSAGSYQGTPAAGAGPVGEVMTGIAIQNQLNSVGGGSAGRVGRRSVNGIANQTTRRQTRALREIEQQ